MPRKCSFCRKTYTQAGAYEEHLRTAHVNLDIILASTVRYTSSAITYHKDTETDLLHHEGHERPDSDYESDLDSTGRGHDAFTDDIANESDTEMLNGTQGSLAGQETHYEGSGEAVGDVNGFEQECDILSKDPWVPFTSAHGFKLASWFIQNKVSKSQINQYFTNRHGTSLLAGYNSMHTLENHLRILDPYSVYLQWFEGQVEDGSRTLPFFYRNVLDCVWYLLRQIAYRDDLVYAPRREYNHSGNRIYAEMHTADWWWDVQVQLPNRFYRNPG